MDTSFYFSIVLLWVILPPGCYEHPENSGEKRKTNHSIVQARHHHKAASRLDLLPQNSNGSLDHGTDVPIDPVPVSFDAVTVSMPASQLATATPVPGEDHSIGFNSAILSAATVPTQIIPGENTPAITAPPVIPPQSPDGDDGGCMRCSLFFESVDVFYWPVASSNTDCLSQITGFSNPALPADASKLYSSLSLQIMTLFY